PPALHVGRDHLALSRRLRSPRAGPPSCGRRRLRNQAQHPALAGQPRHAPHRGPGDDHGRGDPGARARRHLPVQRPGRPRGDRALRGAADPKAPVQRQAAVRHLPRPPDARAGARRHHGEDEVRPPRRQPSGQGPDHRQGGDHEPEPRFRGAPEQPARGGRADPPLAVRRVARRALRAGSARVLRAVPSRGVPRPAGQRLSVRALFAADRGRLMPKRTDIESILVIGAGPIVIGQACEFDYSGTQAVKALRAEGYRVILVNSNPATIMTDPDLADATYVEPVVPESVAKSSVRDRPDACLPTMGGQTALNVAQALAADGTFERYGVELIGASQEAIAKAEDRQLFREAMARIGLEMPRSRVVRSLAEAPAALAEVGLPAIIRPSYTLGGTGGGIAYNRQEFEQIVANGLDASPIHEVLIEESVLGWKEYEMEVVRDRADNCMVLCTIENVGPMGVRTGDSITVSAAPTLTAKEYPRARYASIAVLRDSGVDT